MAWHPVIIRCWDALGSDPARLRADAELKTGAASGLVCRNFTAIFRMDGSEAVLWAVQGRGINAALLLFWSYCIANGAVSARAHMKSRALARLVFRTWPRDMVHSGIDAENNHIYRSEL